MTTDRSDPTGRINIIRAAITDPGAFVARPFGDFQFADWQAIAVNEALGPHPSTAVANIAAALMLAEAERDAHRATLRAVATLAAEWEKSDSSDFRSGPLRAALAAVRKPEAGAR